jgi:hypothetical protein
MCIPNPPPNKAGIQQPPRPYQSRIDNYDSTDRSQYLVNQKGERETHRMAAEVDENGDWYAFPMIVKRKGKLHKFTNSAEAMAWNKKHNNVKKFDNKEDAMHYSINYKKGTPLNNKR